jgi:hypothetical protein
MGGDGTTLPGGVPPGSRIYRCGHNLGSVPSVADVEYDWEAVDSSEAPETCVLLGAGASADAGLPVAAELHQRLVQQLPVHLSRLYRNIADLVFGAGQAVDVERLFRVIQFINTVETEWRPQDTRLRHESLDIAVLVASWKDELQHYLTDQRSTTQGTPTGLLIDALYDALWSILWLYPSDQPDVRYLRYLLLSMRGGTIVTLNYDNALEQASLSGTGRQLDAGPYPKDYSIPMPGWDRANVVRVIKLHGSLGWKTDPRTGHVSDQDPNDVPMSRLVNQMMTSRPPVPGIIFGAGNKLRPDGPYLDLYVEFKEALWRARRLIVIGYGWSDEHINEVIRRWLQVPSQRLFRVSSLNSTALPSEQQSWVYGADKVIVQVETGPSKTTMADLMRPSSRLQR